MEVDEILELMEGLIHHIFKGALGKDIQIPFQRLTWDDAMDRFGSDKPDLRFGMELKNVSEAVQGCTFQVFNNVIANGGQVKCINVKDMQIFRVVSWMSSLNSAASTVLRVWLGCNSRQKAA